MQRTVLITGSSRGIGHRVTRDLLARGHKVIGIARSVQHPEDNFIPISCDLEKIHLLKEQAKQWARDFSEVDTLILNAGKGIFKHLEELSYDEMESLLHLNLLAPMIITKAFLSLLKQKTHSKIIAIGSEAALEGAKCSTLYSASKFGLRGFVQSLRKECASSPTHVTLIHPGLLQSNFYDHAHFCPSTHPYETLLPEDLLSVIDLILSSRSGVNFEEISVKSQRKVINFKSLSKAL